MKIKALIVSVVIFFLLTTISYGRSVSFTWDHNTEPDLLGYTLHSGVESGVYTYTLAKDIPAGTNTITVDVPDGQWYFALTAYDTEALESDYSNEVLLAAYYYNFTIYQYNTGGLVTYKGEHTQFDALYADENWVITKYYYDVVGVLLGTKTRITSWNDRAIGW